MVLLKLGWKLLISHNLIFDNRIIVKIMFLFFTELLAVFINYLVKFEYLSIRVVVLEIHKVSFSLDLWIKLS